MESTAEPWLPPVPDELPRGGEPEERCGNCGHKLTGHARDDHPLELFPTACLADGCVCREYEPAE